MRLEKRALSIIISGEDYQTAIKKLGIKPLQIHHENLCEKLFQAVISDSTHKINKLLPMKNKAKYDIIKTRTFEVPRARANIACKHDCLLWGGGGGWRRRQSVDIAI